MRNLFIDDVVGSDQQLQSETSTSANCENLRAIYCSPHVGNLHRSRVQRPECAANPHWRHQHVAAIRTKTPTLSGPMRGLSETRVSISLLEICVGQRW